MSNEKVEEKYTYWVNTPGDIHEHLPTLKKYAEEVNHITEMGVRWVVSTWALLMGKPQKMISYDWGFNEHIEELIEITKDIDTDFTFIQADTGKIEIELTDLLFIDTMHTYEHLKLELSLHAKNVNKYIILHDTITFGRRGQDGSTPGLIKAVDEFLQDNEEWQIKEHFSNNNGLTILERVA